MTVTATTVAGPSSICPGFKIAAYDLAWSTDYTTGGDPLTTLLNDFTYVYAIIPGGNDTLADNGYVIDSIIPGPTTAVTAANCLMTVHWTLDTAHSGGANAVLQEFTDDGDLSAIGQCSIVVIGF